ncbi:MAG: hydrogenase [Omnitrophica bacterium RIFCSPLOWO2_02_FULL_45_16]|nr:MAG: hydrogenase [Omnitrophica bacterium RIFCSPLOWO2_01_FULL_45_24]OGW99682.1 MAG: hydrogenase [Omnitrophica bacterium RIFCSPLOWO2_02_FULL_45_16]
MSRITGNEYLPKMAMIETIVDHTPDTKTFTLRLIDKNEKILQYKPGQFLMLSLSGYGEAPFTFASCPSPSGRFQISVRKVGTLTGALHKLKEKDVVGVRGPYGNTFPLDRIKNKDILFVAGGCGIAPLRSLIQHVLKNRKDHGRIEIIYGCRTPKDICYREEIKSWKSDPDADIHLTVDEPDESWGGTCGVVCVLLPKIKLNPKAAMVFLCGPAVMIKSAIKDVLKLGFGKPNIYASLERYMKCGIGKCGHCYIKDKYACLDGPNFSYSEMKKMGIDS